MREFFLVVFAAGVRRASNASPRPGRIFNQGSPSDSNRIEAFARRAEAMILKMESYAVERTSASTLLYQADARDTKLESNNYDFCMCHPPYFALYRYSSDVLRFELEWLGFKRKEIALLEIEDGYKTSNRNLYYDYIKDLKDVFKEAYRLLKSDACLCLVDNNSTFRDESLPVIEDLILGAFDCGFRAEKHVTRSVRFAQASYHRSGRADKQTKEDHLVFFRKR